MNANRHTSVCIDTSLSDYVIIIIVRKFIKTIDLQITWTLYENDMNLSDLKPYYGVISAILIIICKIWDLKTLNL